MTQGIININSAYEILDIAKNLPDNTVFFLDVDDTIITPKSKTFRKAPYNKIIDQIKLNKDNIDNYKEILSNWRKQRKIILLDEQWPEVIQKLKDNFLVYALTKIDIGEFGNISSMEDWRYNELKGLDVVFSQQAIDKNYVSNGSSFYHGILMTGDNSKSNTLNNFNELLSLKSIVMVDDRIEYLRDIENYCNNNEIFFTGIKFDRLSIINDVQEEKVFYLQKKYLLEKKVWLEDEDALGLLQLLD